MSPLTLPRRARRTALVGVVTAVLATIPVTVPRAHADSSTTAAAKVRTLLARVHELHAEALVAERRFQRGYGTVVSSVDAAISADQRSSQLAQDAARARDGLDAQITALYESGGSTAVYASLLVAGNLNDFADRAVMASRAVHAQTAAVHQAAALAATAAARATDTAVVQRRRIATERTLSAAATKFNDLLAQQQALLATANRHLAAVRAAEAALAGESAAFGSIATSQLDGLHILPPSASYLHLYRAAATTCPGLSWTVLAAIGQVESGHGRNPSTSSAGAMGPMQFEPATFARYAVDGDHSGTASIMSPADSIYTAAHYLCANGGGNGSSALDAAILHYNHAEWYLAMVLKLAGEYAASY